MTNVKRLLTETFPEHAETVETLLEGDAAFSALSEEYGRLASRLDRMNASALDPQAAATAGTLKRRLADLHDELRGLIEQSSRV